LKRISTIILATRNQNKIKEITSILGPDIEYKTISNSLNINMKETGRTLLENSLAKATFAFKLTATPSLADDSGLFVDALDGDPGVYSSRYGKDDKDRITRLLNNLADKKDRSAKFRAVFVYYYAPNKFEVFEGECEGQITQEIRGTKGFGYDPIFMPKGYKKTFAELGQVEKNRISHRAKALAKFKEYLKL
jgi:XTP/dITP diphosphohydrolase